MVVLFQNSRKIKWHKHSCCSFHHHPLKSEILKEDTDQGECGMISIDFDKKYFEQSHTKKETLTFSTSQF